MNGQGQEQGQGHEQEQQGQQQGQQQEQSDIQQLLAALTSKQAQEPAQEPEPAPVQQHDAPALSAAYADPAVAAMRSVLAASAPNIDVDRAISNAVLHGDLSLIDSAYLKEIGGKNADNLIAIANGLVQQTVNSAVALQNEVYSTAGSEENWDAAVAVYQKEAPDHIKVAIKQLVDSGKRENVLAAARTVIEFGKQSGSVINKGVQMRGSPTTDATKALDKRTFQAELNKLNPNSRDFTEQYEALLARRALGKRLGQ